VGVQPFFGKVPQPSLWVGLQTARVKITINGLNYCIVFIVHIQTSIQK